jgi:hypothetical protein
MNQRHRIGVARLNHEDVHEVVDARYRFSSTTSAITSTELRFAATCQLDLVLGESTDRESNDSQTAFARQLREDRFATMRYIFDLHQWLVGEAAHENAQKTPDNFLCHGMALTVKHPKSGTKY